jgi:hypothetical protein
MIMEIQQGNTLESYDQITLLANRSGNSIVGSLKSFRKELASMLAEFADPNSALHINGKTYSAEEKATAGVQLLLQDRIDQIDNVETTLIGILNTLFQLDKSAGQIGTA